MPSWPAPAGQSSAPSRARREATSSINRLRLRDGQQRMRWHTVCRGAETRRAPVRSSPRERRPALSTEARNPRPFAVSNPGCTTLNGPGCTYGYITLPFLPSPESVRRQVLQRMWRSADVAAVFALRRRERRGRRAMPSMRRGTRCAASRRAHGCATRASDGIARRERRECRRQRLFARRTRYRARPRVACGIAGADPGRASRS